MKWFGGTTVQSPYHTNSTMARFYIAPILPFIFNLLQVPLTDGFCYSRPLNFAIRPCSSSTTQSPLARLPEPSLDNNDWSAEDLDNAMELSHLMGRLKQTPRTGWIRRGIVPCESVADHSWRMAAMALLLPSSSPRHDDSDDLPLDIDKCVAMAIVHDLAEALVGDICPDDGVPAHVKQQREHEAMQYMANLLPQKSRFQALFDEYEARQTPEARVVKDLDLLDMILQANEYEEQAKLVGTSINLDEFFQGTPPSRFQTARIREMAQAVHQERHERIQQQNKIFAESNSYSVAQLSPTDQAFVQTYAQASSWEASEIATLVQALRTHEANCGAGDVGPT